MIDPVIDLIRVPSKAVHAVLPTVGNYLDVAMDHCNGEADGSSIADGILDGTYLLWVLHDQERHETVGAVVTGFVNYAHKFKLDIVAAAASIAEEFWIQHLETLYAFAQEIGAVEIEFHGRPGWSKRLGKHGYKVAQVKMVKEVTHEQS